MRHHNRETEVDLHHNLAPPVSRIRIDAARLWEDAVMAPEEYGRQVAVLAPVDMLLHNAIHLFMNDELRGGLRDVVDFRDLFEHFLGQDAAFEEHLLARARGTRLRTPAVLRGDHGTSPGRAGAVGRIPGARRTICPGSSLSPGSWRG